MLTARVTCALHIHVILSVRHIRAVYVEFIWIWPFRLLFLFNVQLLSALHLLRY